MAATVIVKVSIYAKQSGAADNFVSIFIGDGVFCLGNNEKWGRRNGSNEDTCHNDRFYFALKDVESAIVSVGIGPLFVLVLAVIAKESIPRMQWLIAIAAMIACIVLSGNSAVQLDLLS